MQRPRHCRQMDHQRQLAPWLLVVCRRCRWTPGMSFHPASWTTPAMSSPFNKQHCRTRRRSSLCHAPWHVRTHSPFHPSLSTKPTLAPHQHIPRHRPRTVIRCAEKFDFVMCARLCAIGCSGRGRGAHWMPETRRRIYSLLPYRARCTRICCGRRVRACFVAFGKLNVLITTAGAIKPLRPYPREVVTRGGTPPRSTSAGSSTRQACVRY